MLVNSCDIALILGAGIVRDLHDRKLTGPQEAAVHAALNKNARQSPAFRPEKDSADAKGIHYWI